LAEARDEAVMAAWAGLGYYARARNLLACARRVVELGGDFPADLEALKALPGIGEYTASAVGAIAFGLPTVPVDGNVERVMSRIHAIETPLPQAKPLIKEKAAALMSQAAARVAPSDTAQALFDLGATLCSPNAPACTICPWEADCDGRKRGIAGSLPRKAPKPERPRRHGAHFHLMDRHGHLLLRRRADKGLLGGMTEIPGTDWRAAEWHMPEALAQAPMPHAHWVKLGTVRHVFTHFELLLDVYAATVPDIPKAAIADGFLCPEEALSAQALPSLMVKCLRLGHKKRPSARAVAADHPIDLLV
jgi:A/G-specific adenine glycosylase